MYTIDVVVKGSGRGLLMHKFSVEAESELSNQVKKAKPARPTREVEAEQVAYRLLSANGDKGQLCLPDEHFLSAMSSAAAGLKIVGRGKKSYKSSFQGAVDVSPTAVGLVDPATGKPLFEYEIDSRSVRIPATKGRVIRHRPFLKEWQAAFTITVHDSGIPEEVIQSALVTAGQEKGVGDYRPRFGQFMLVKFATNKDEQE